jgi:hypothetical protein
MEEITMKNARLETVPSSSNTCLIKKTLIPNERCYTTLDEKGVTCYCFNVSLQLCEEMRDGADS